MKFNSKCNRYVTKDGLVYRLDAKTNQLVICKLSYNKFGYLQVFTECGTKTVHRLVYETFINELPKGMDVDHINDIKDDNRLENLRALSHKDNSLKLSTVIATMQGMRKKGYAVNESNFLRNVTCI